MRVSASELLLDLGDNLRSVVYPKGRARECTQVASNGWGWKVSVQDACEGEESVLSTLGKSLGKLGGVMETQIHKKKHEELHKMLDQLVADWIWHTKKMPSEASILDLVAWSFEQTKNPTPGEGGGEAKKESLGDKKFC